MTTTEPKLGLRDRVFNRVTWVCLFAEETWRLRETSSRSFRTCAANAVEHANLWASVDWSMRKQRALDLAREKHR